MQWALGNVCAKKCWIRHSSRKAHLLTWLDHALIQSCAQDSLLPGRFPALLSSPGVPAHLHDVSWLLWASLTWTSFITLPSSQTTPYCPPYIRPEPLVRVQRCSCHYCYKLSCLPMFVHSSPLPTPPLLSQHLIVTNTCRAFPSGTRGLSHGRHYQEAGLTQELSKEPLQT